MTITTQGVERLLRGHQVLASVTVDQGMNTGLVGHRLWLKGRSWRRIGPALQIS